MDKLSTLTRFKASCPFLGRTQTATLRTLCTNASPRFPSISVLTERATKCPVMGPALTVRGKELVAGYASVAGAQDVAQIHKDQGVSVPAGATIEMCPHASAARAAARMASDLASAAKKPEPKQDTAKAAAAAGCPFHKAGAPIPAEHPPIPNAAAHTATTTSAAPTPARAGFNYEGFYVNELEKKHQDKSYRYFNNINRLAAKFPVAHTGDVKDEVHVWCSNDYLGMGNNPVVLETMQYAIRHPNRCCCL
jgi:5-aminolevulinate synthase